MLIMKENRVMQNIKEKLAFYAELIENYIEETRALRAAGVPAALFESMEYSLTAGGKRIRPALCMASAEVFGVSNTDALPMALALEMFHTATLIHDDLPCMDNDDMRRGKPSNHAKFGETMATLAGDSLLTQSIEFPVHNIKNITPEKILNAVRIFSAAMGPSGVCGGQVLDIFHKDKEKDLDYVRLMASLKTGALLKSSVQTGAALGTSDESVIKKFGEYGMHLGAAFQIIDDILDVTATAEDLGKTPGKDAEQGKLTYVAALGVDGARVLAAEETAASKEIIKEFVPYDNFLMQLPDYLLERSR